jgi:hypothetical protein
LSELLRQKSKRLSALYEHKAYLDKEITRCRVSDYQKPLASLLIEYSRIETEISSIEKEISAAELDKHKHEVEILRLQIEFERIKKS